MGTVGVGYVALDDRVDETLVVERAAFNELFDVTTDDFDVIVELFAEVDDALDVVVEVFVVDEMSLGAPFGAGAPLTTRS